MALKKVRMDNEKEGVSTCNVVIRYSSFSPSYILFITIIFLLALLVLVVFVPFNVLVQYLFINYLFTNYLLENINF